MLYGVQYVLKYLLGKDLAGRNLAVYPDDTFLVSFPRSGNTWTRFLMANLAHPGTEVSFANIERLIPDTASQSSRTLKRTPRPRIIKSHEYFDARYPKVIYIVRDPRDVALSAGSTVISTTPAPSSSTSASSFARFRGAPGEHGESTWQAGSSLAARTPTSG
jgi:hypothetical protein